MFSTEGMILEIIKITTGHLDICGGFEEDWEITLLVTHSDIQSLFPMTVDGDNMATFEYTPKTLKITVKAEQLEEALRNLYSIVTSSGGWV